MTEFCSAGTLLGLAEEKQAVIAVIGCGGKTTFIESLANEYRHKKVLVTPSTKIFPMHGEAVILRKTEAECLTHRPVNGIQCLGVLNKRTGKLEALRQDHLDRIIPHYDIVLIEADGSNGLPCKGWLQNEPVIPLQCRHTLGIVTLTALGKAADENTVFRLDEFLKLTGLRQGDVITRQALTDMVCARKGMFHNSINNNTNKQSVFVNQVEDENCASITKEWLKGIKELTGERFFRLAYGSARMNKWSRL